MSESHRKTGKALLVLAVVLIVIFLLLLPPTQDLFRKYLLDPFSSQYPEEVEMELRRTMILDANGGHVTQYRFDLPRPASISDNGTYLQQVTSLNISPQYDELWDNGTYRTMVWEGDDLYGQISIVVTQSVRQTLQQWDLDEDTVLDKGDIPQDLQDRYLHEEWQIIIDDPIISELSHQIVGDEDNVYVIARSIYDWMVENVEYPNQIISGEPKSSLQTNEDRRGDCDDQSILFCALARSAGVPAWLQLGALYDRSTGEMGGHGWVQMFMPTEDGGVNVTIDIVNKDFLVWMPNLFCEYTDNGEPDGLRDYYHMISVFYDASTYGPGETPEFSESWEVLSYQESDDKVTLSVEMMAKVEI
ncbi:MAG: transglutaminase domain-containing protein [Methanomassiliicoccales archaeon]|nr:transglutaminase domain-containing protein [Methanomassiliicoccales archaeon]TFG57408.1 MAG: hypothetical protein E4H30_00500 [Methanomassiliicoccus sp.]